MLNVGGPEMLVIFLVALLILGPDKLPAAARQAGSFMAKVRQYSDGFRNEIQKAMDDAVDTGGKESSAQQSESERPDPDIHEVKAIAEPDVHEEVESHPQANGQNGQAPAEATLRAVPDPAAPGAAGSGSDAGEGPKPDAAAI